MSILTAALFMGPALLSDGQPEYKCDISPLVKAIVNETCPGMWSTFQDNLTVPWDVKKGECDHCLRYDEKSMLFPLDCSYWFPEANRTKTRNHSKFPTVECTSWSYNTDHFTSTVDRDFDLVCRNTWKFKFTTFVLMAGVMIGVVLSGYISDRIGRLKTHLLSTILTILTATGASFAADYWTFAILEFFLGGFYIASYSAIYVLAMEVASSRHRVKQGNSVTFGFSCCIILLSGLGYVFRSWRTVQQVVALATSVTAILLWKYCYESPRWLLAKNRESEALAVLHKMARVNGKPEVKIDIKDDSEGTEKFEQDGALLDEDTDQEYLYVDLLKNITLRKTTLILCYNWFACSCVYFGLTFNSSQLSGNVFLNLFLCGLVETPSLIASAFLMDMWGRRPIMCVNLLLSAFALFAMFMVPEGMTVMSLVLFLIGKFGASSSFAIIYIYTNELYPTPMRGKGLGVCSSCARIGGMVSVPIAMLFSASRVLPYLIFGTIAMLAGNICLDLIKSYLDEHALNR